MVHPIFHGGKRCREAIGPSKREAQLVLGKRLAAIREGKFFDVKKGGIEEQTLQVRLLRLADLSPTGVGQCVYFLQARQGGPVKIGYTRDLAGRMQALGTASPTPLRVLATVPGGTQETEAALHRAFAPSRLQGEWFRLTADLVNHIILLRTAAHAPAGEEVPHATL